MPARLIIAAALGLVLLLVLIIRFRFQAMIAILIGALDIPKICVLLNPIVFLIVGTACRKIDPVKFQDLPGIIMPSFGLSMFGLIGILNLI